MFEQKAQTEIQAQKAEQATVQQTAVAPISCVTDLLQV